MPAPQHESEFGQLDPVYLHSRREACVILALWACCLLWTVGYYRLAGYDLAVEDVNLTFGMPSWVFYGVLLPWIFATVFSVGFSLFVMKDDDLGEELAEPDEGSLQNALNPSDRAGGSTNGSRGNADG